MDSSQLSEINKLNLTFYSSCGHYAQVISFPPQRLKTPLA
ncbi:hypothetical protein N0824_04171 [Microcystis sp. 0824]|nr:hypothetical protein N0824_04171 [Microcystis sp. 0824]